MVARQVGHLVVPGIAFKESKQDLQNLCPHRVISIFLGLIVSKQIGHSVFNFSFFIISKKETLICSGIAFTSTCFNVS